MNGLHHNTTHHAEARSAGVAIVEATEKVHGPDQSGQDTTRVPWYMAVLCRVGIHQGKWSYVAAGHCTQMRECQRCRTVQVRTKHLREWRYIGIGTCEQIRTCKRCDALSGHRTRHEAWSKPWNVDSNTSAHRCKRCGVIEEWDTSTYD